MAFKPKTRRPLYDDHKPWIFRKSSGERGYGSWWDAYSKRLRIENPYCVACELLYGVFRDSEEVDHKTPKLVEPEADREPTNHWCLCSVHHGQKTRIEGRSTKAEMLRWRHMTDRELVTELFIERLNDAIGKTTDDSGREAEKS